jgi:hypothetical protein
MDVLRSRPPSGFVAAFAFITLKAHFSARKDRIKDSKDTLRRDKSSCHCLRVNEARLKMGFLAYNLLHLIR